MDRAVTFPGQGSQSVGMGSALAGGGAGAIQVFEEVDEALGFSLSTLIQEGPAEMLTLTENAQPAILAVSIAAFRTLEEAFGEPVAPCFRFFAGHSLGEYSALCAAGALQLADCARLLRTRGRAMQAAVPAGAGAMAAVIGLDLEQVRKVLDGQDGEGACVPANDNAPGQVTISGSAAAVERAAEACRAAGAKRVLPLDVSAPFHCPLMEPAARVMEERLAGIDIRAPQVPVVSNVTARPVVEPEEIRRLLVQQVTGMVRWRESVEYMVGQGIESLVECGSGKVLSGLARRIHRSAETCALATPEDARRLAAELTGG